METVTVTEGIVNIVQLSVEGGLCSRDKMHRFLLPLPPQPKGVAMAWSTMNLGSQLRIRVALESVT